RLEDLVYEVLHGTHHRDHLWRLRVGHVNLHLQVDLEDEALTALALDGAELRVKVVGDRAGVGPVQREDEGGNLLGRVDARVERVLARPQRLALDASLPWRYVRAELVLGPRSFAFGLTC